MDSEDIISGDVMDWREPFFKKLDAYCEATGRARSGVGKMILNDPKFFDEVEEGRTPGIDLKIKVETWLDENMPKTKKLKSKKPRSN